MFHLDGLFTSESVSEGHPDKVCDLIADSILDECLKQDKKAHVALEIQAGRGYVWIGGNVKTTAIYDAKTIARNVLRDIGYVSEDLGLSANNCLVVDAIDKQSSDIDNGVNNSLEAREAWSSKSVISEDEAQGAGDQGMMFGYASNDTKTYMPMAIAVSHELVHAATIARKNGSLSWARPDMKAQVTVLYKGGKPVSIDTVVMSIQHNPEVTNEQIKNDTVLKIILPVLAKFGYNGADHYYVNPSGRFVIGGPAGDVGVVGRKIIVDTYGGYCPHGGGAFSGKDPSKVDRSAAYAARYVAKNIVAAGLASEVQVQLAYAIGKAEPVSINVTTFGTGTIPDAAIAEAVAHIFKLSPIGIIKSLDLLRPIYALTTNYGHFGRELPEFTWEKTDKIGALQECFSKVDASIINGIKENA